MFSFIDKIVEFFTNDSVSLSRKITVPLVVIIILLFINDYYGFTYYFFNSREADYIVQLEKAKQSCAKDSVVYKHFDKMMIDALNRKNVFQLFSGLFRSSSSGSVSPPRLGGTVLESTYKRNVGERKPLFDFLPLCKRNQLWHTITSSLSLLLLFPVILVTIPVLFFSGKLSNNAPVIIGLLIFLCFISFLVWLFQWSFGLIPVLFGRAYLNYSIQVLVNVAIMIFGYKIIKKNTK